MGVAAAGAGSPTSYALIHTPRRKPKPGLTASLQCMLSLQGYPSLAEAQPEVVAVAAVAPSSIAKSLSSSKPLNTNSPVAALQSKLDAIAKEQGDTYIEGIQPVFEPLTSTRGIGFAMMPSLCGMTFFAAASPPSITILQRNALLGIMSIKQTRVFLNIMLTAATYLVVRRTSSARGLGKNL